MQNDRNIAKTTNTKIKILS